MLFLLTEAKCLSFSEAMSIHSGKDIDGNLFSKLHNQRGGLFNPAGAQIATSIYAGLFTLGTGNYYLWNTSSWTDLVNKWTSLNSQNYRLISLNTDYDDPTTTWFVGCWTEGTGGSYLWRTSDWEDFTRVFSMNKSSLRLLDIDIHAAGGTRYFTGTQGHQRSAPDRYRPIDNRIDKDWKYYQSSIDQ